MWLPGASEESVNVALPVLPTIPVPNTVLPSMNCTLPVGGGPSVLLTVAVSVLATLSASVLERRRDFALMKALGASQSQLLGHFLLEAIVIASAGVILGYILGSILAWAIGQWNFGTATLPRASLLPLVLLLNLAIATAAALFPARILRKLQPAALLKGE